MKKKFKQINIDDPIYRAPFSIFIGDESEIKKLLMKNGFYDYGEIHDAKYIPSGNKRAIILKKTDIPTIAHEVLHYCFEVFESRGIPIRYENDEVMAYYFEMTIKNILKAKLK